MAGEGLFPRVLNFKAGHIHLLARACDPGGCDLFPDPFSYCDALMFQVSTRLLKAFSAWFLSLCFFFLLHTHSDAHRSLYFTDSCFLFFFFSLTSLVPRAWYIQKVLNKYPLHGRISEWMSSCGPELRLEFFLHHSLCSWPWEKSWDIPGVHFFTYQTVTTLPHGTLVHYGQRTEPASLRTHRSGQTCLLWVRTNV